MICISLALKEHCHVKNHVFLEPNFLVCITNSTWYSQSQKNVENLIYFQHPMMFTLYLFLALNQIVKTITFVCGQLLINSTFTVQYNATGLMLHIEHMNVCF